MVAPFLCGYRTLGKCLCFHGERSKLVKYSLNSVEAAFSEVRSELGLLSTCGETL